MLMQSLSATCHHHLFSSNVARMFAADLGSARELDQFYTRPDVATRLYTVFALHCPVAECLLVEPSAGYGAFYRVMPLGSIAVDIAPRCQGVIRYNFLRFEVQSYRPIAILGNPPFGRNSSLAVRFFNHAATQATYIGFILPRTFLKASIVNRLDRSFHLVHVEDVEADAFVFEGKPYHVPTVFMIWKREAGLRAVRPEIRSHADFKFTKRDHADFAIRRIGANAGKVLPAKDASLSSHLFIKGRVKGTMKKLRKAFAKAAANTAGCPSLTQPEVVEIYQAIKDAQA